MFSKIKSLFKKEGKDGITIEQSLVQSHRVKTTEKGGLKLSASHKLLLSYMQQQYNEHKELGKPFCKTFDEISEETGINVRTLKRKMKDFATHGIITITHVKLPQHIGFQKTNCYTVNW